MNDKITAIRRKVFLFMENHAILLSAVAIFGYYLLTTVDLFKHSAVKKNFLDYVLQFDSVILMWVLAVVLTQLQKYRGYRREQEEYRKKIEHEFERQRMHLQLLDEITALLQDNVNNPLAVISITTHNIRRRFETDAEILAWLDRIDASLKRVHAVVNDIKSFQTQKIVQESLKSQVQAKQLN